MTPELAPPERVAVVGIDRPDRRNAMVPETVVALAEQIRAIGRGGAHRAIVFAGSGDAFCVGLDLKWLTARPDPAAAVAEMVAAHHRLVRAMVGSPVPIVAAVNGPAAGGGISLALAADYRVAAFCATFTAAYFRLALPPDGGNSMLLPRAIGVGRTMELLLSNRTLPAEEARAWGLVSEVVPAGALLERAYQVALAVSDVPPETLLDTRLLLDRATGVSLDEVLDREEQRMREAAHRPAFAAALRAYAEARERLGRR